MSLFVFGDIVFRDAPVNLVVTAKHIDGIVQNSGFYMKFGGNVSNQYFKSVSQASLGFEITDSIVDNTASCLFAGPNQTFFINDAELEIAPWEERISAVSHVLREILSMKDVDHIILNIGIDSLEEMRQQSVPCTVSALSDVLLELSRNGMDDLCVSLNLSQGR